MEKKKILIQSTTQVEQMLNDLVERTGESKSTIIRSAIQQLHGRTFKDYLEIQKARIKTMQGITEEDKERMKLKREDIRKDMKVEKMYNEGKRICELLEGQEIDYGNNQWNCKFECYDIVAGKVESGWMNLPFEELTEDLLDIKWRGKKEEVLKLLAKNKK